MRDTRGRKVRVYVSIAVTFMAVIFVAAIIALHFCKKKESNPTPHTLQTALPTAQQTQKSPSQKVVTDSMKKKLEPLLEETTYFFALLGGVEHIEDSDLNRTMMVYYNLQYRDSAILDGQKERLVKPEAEEELKNLFGENAKYELGYSETFPGCLYVKEDGCVRYNGGDWGESVPWAETLSVVSLGAGRYRAVRYVGLKSNETGEISRNRKITCYIVEKPSAKYGYTFEEFRDFRKGDSTADKRK